MKHVLVSLAKSGVLAAGIALVSAPALASDWQSVAEFGTAVKALTVDPTDGNTMYVSLNTSQSDTSGVWKSEDGGATWSRALETPGKVIQSITVDPDNPTYVWAGWDSAKMSVSTNSGGSWTDVSGFGPGSKVYDIAVPGGNNPATGPYKVFCGTLNGVYRYDAVRAKLEQLTDFLSIPAVEVCPTNGDIIYAGRSTDGMLRSTDGGATWDEIGVEAFDGKGRVRELSVNPNNCDQLMIRVWEPNFQDFLGVSDDGGTTWTEIMGKTGKGSLIAGSGPAYMSGGIDAGMYYSTTGTAYDNITAGLTSSIQAFAVDPADDFHVYAGTETGISHINVDLHPGAPGNLDYACVDHVVTLTWDAVTENADGSPIDDLAGYVIWKDVPPFGNVDAPVDTVWDAGATEYQHIDVTDLVLLYTATGLDAANQTGPISNFTETVIPSTCTGIGGDAPGTPGASRTALAQNHPNPFNPSTTLRYSVSEADAGQPVQLAIYDARGELVKTLVTGTATLGSHAVVWNGVADNGAGVASGIYFSRLEVGSTHEVRSMVLLK